MTNKLKTRVFYITAILIILSIIAYGRLSLYLLKINHSISICFVDDIYTVGREQAVVVKYHYWVDGKVHCSDVSYNHGDMKEYENFKLFQGKSFPIVYSLKNIGLSSEILVFPNDFKYFDIPYPDSLKWIIPLMEK